MDHLISAGIALAIIAAIFGLLHWLMRRMEKNYAAVRAEQYKKDAAVRVESDNALTRENLRGKFMETFDMPFIEADSKNLGARRELEYRVDQTLHALANTLSNLFEKEVSQQSLHRPSLDTERLKVEIDVLKKQFWRTFCLVRDLEFPVRWLSFSRQVLLCTEKEIIAQEEADLVGALGQYEAEIRAYIPKIPQEVFTRSFYFSDLPVKERGGQSNKGRKGLVASSS